VSGSMVDASAGARKRVKTRAVKEVSHYLGNTPAVARASYIDPRVFDCFDAGRTIDGAFLELVSGDDIGAPAVQSGLEAAVLAMISETGSEALERAA